jgi:hypothetical protein
MDTVHSLLAYSTLSVTSHDNSSQVNDDRIQAPTSAQKWWASVILGMLFFIVSSSFMFGITSSVFGVAGTAHHTSVVQHLVHAVIFILLVRIILG